jgi:hypothetical protein
MTTISNLEAHGIPVTAYGKPLDTTKVVYSPEELRSLLDLGLDEQGREAHYQALYGGITPANTGASIAQTISAHVVGNAALSDEAKAQAATAFPLTVHVAAAAGPLTVNAANSPYDLSTPDGSLKTVTYTDVIIEQGGYFVCYATPLSFTCTTLTRVGNSGSGAADFNIQGRTGSTPAAPGAPTGATQASGGYGGECSSAGISGHGGGPGNPGATGTPGTSGGPGGDGLPSQQATIVIQTTLNNPITIFTQSGPGGTGGNGGPGGPGQQGGNGGGGVTCGCTGNAGGQGGDGGTGGTGGTAGNGGNGVDAHANIAVYVPSPADVGKVTYASQSAFPGNPGTPGTGGPGGGGGTGGGGGKDNGGGSHGGTGAQGATGARGLAGAGTGVAASVTVSPL